MRRSFGLGCRSGIRCRLGGVGGRLGIGVRGGFGGGVRGGLGLGIRRGGGLGLGWGVGYVDQFDVEDEVGFCGDDGWAARLTIGELVGDEEAALASDVHAVEASVPAGDDLAGAVGEGDGGATVHG